MPRITIRDLCKHRDACNNDPPPPPSENHSFSLLKIFTICSLAATSVFVCYIIMIKIRGVFQSRRRRRIYNPNPDPDPNETPRQDLNNLTHEDHDPVVFHPIWLINTVGLDRSVIDSIEVFKYRKEDGLIGLTDSDCPVCLGVFEDGDLFRVLPKCGHAFHVECIDTWLRAHVNCPLCRAAVVNNNINNNTSVGQGRNSVESSVREGIPVDTSGGVGEKIEPIRRSVSMGSVCFGGPNVARNESGASVIGGRGVKSSSFGPRIGLEEL